MPRLDSFLGAYLECAVWSSTHFTGEDDTNGTPFDQLPNDWHPDAIEQARRECAAFQDANRDDLADLDDAQAGHDFWLTRNGHGAGFWGRGYHDGIGDRLTAASEKAGERDLELGDDGFIYFSPRA